MFKFIVTSSNVFFFFTCTNVETCDTERANLGKEEGTFALLCETLLINPWLIPFRHHLGQTLIANVIKVSLDKDNNGPTIRLYSAIQK